MKNKVVRFTSDDGVFACQISVCPDPSVMLPDGYDVEASYRNIYLGSLFFDRVEDFVMFADCLSEFIEDRGLRKEASNG